MMQLERNTNRQTTEVEQSLQQILEKLNEQEEPSLRIEMANNLRIMAWNANGLLQHQQELQVVLELEKIDVCLISETHFTNQSYIKFKGYKTYYTIHPENSAKGGSAIIIKENIVHYEEMGNKAEEIQATSVVVKINNYPITLVAIYCPPKHSLKKEQYLEFLRKWGNKFIIGGDFNAKNMLWGSRLTTTKGKELYNAITDYRCEVLSTGTPTYWPTDPNKTPDLIDFFIVKNISTNFLQTQAGWDMNSDHSPIILTLSQNIIEKETKPILVNKHTDWANFAKRLEERINLAVSLKTEDELDKEVNLFVINIQQAAWENTPTIKRKTVGNNYPKEIKQLITEKRKQRRRWQQTRAPQDKTKLNNLSQQLKREIQQIKNESINSFLKELTYDSSTDYSLWRTTKRLKRPITQIPPLRIEGNKWARSNQEKADLYANHLEQTFQTDKDEKDEIMWNDNTQPEDENIQHTTPKEVLKEIKENINPRKAPGFDLITGEVLRNLPRKAIIKLTNLINASFRLRYVPSLWKIAEVIMIPKPGKPPHEKTSYRPISLLPVISKLFEKLLYKRLKPIIERKKLIPTHQFGFRKEHSTIDQIHRITSVIEAALEEKKVCSAVFLDVAQAFDRVWHEGLIQKLKEYLPKQLTEILQSYISDRFFRVKQEEAYSELKEIKAGVPQGSVLGPILYLLYTCDIPQPENDTIATFADDTAILAVGNDNIESTVKLQTAISKIEKWTRKWRIRLNETKSVQVDFTNKKIVQIPVNINGQIIPYANKAKYLGMTLDAKLCWKPHVKMKKQELKIKNRKMYWLIGRNSTLSLQNKILLYKQVIRPVWTYGVQLWGCTKQSNRTMIQRFQNKILRSITNAPWYVRNSDLHRDLGMETVDEIIKIYARNHEKRLHHHKNVEAIQLLDTTGLERRLKRLKPFELV